VDRESIEEQHQQNRESPLWYAAYTKHQHEKRSAHLLTQKGVDTYLPLYQSTRRWQDREKTLELPLFPGYVFFRSLLYNRIEILKTPGVFFIVESAGRACPIPNADIDSIRKIAASRAPIEPHPFLKSGDLVEIIRGPLAGVRGVLSRVKNRVRVVVCVDLLQKAVAVETNLADLEIIPARKSPLLIGDRFKDSVCSSTARNCC